MAYWKSFLQRPLNSQCVRYDNYMMLIFGTFSVSESSAPENLILFSLREEFVAGRLLYLTLLFRIHFITFIDAFLMLLQIFFKIFVFSPGLKIEGEIFFFQKFFKKKF